MKTPLAERDGERENECLFRFFLRRVSLRSKFYLEDDLCENTTPKSTRLKMSTFRDPNKHRKGQPPVIRTSVEKGNLLNRPFPQLTTFEEAFRSCEQAVPRIKAHGTPVRLSPNPARSNKRRIDHPLTEQSSFLKDRRKAKWNRRQRFLQSLVTSRATFLHTL